MDVTAIVTVSERYEIDVHVDVADDATPDEIRWAVWRVATTTDLHHARTLNYGEKITDLESFKSTGES